MTAGQALFGEKGGDAAAAQRLGVEAGALEFCPGALCKSLQESRWHSLAQVAGCLGRGQVLATGAGVAAQRLSAVYAFLTPE